MLKTIKIGNQEYNMKSSAFTPFKYKNEYGKDLLKEIAKINSKNKEINKLPVEDRDEAWLGEFSDILEMALRIAYTMIIEYDKNFKPYENWLEEIDNLFENTSWLQEVMELAMSTFRGGVPHKQ